MTARPHTDGGADWRRIMRLTSIGAFRAALALAVLPAPGIALAQSSVPQFQVRSIPPSPKGRERVYRTDQLILKVAPGVDEQSVLNKVLSNGKEAFDGGSASEIRTMGDGAVLLDVSALVGSNKESSSGGHFAVEPAGAKESTAAPGSLDDLVQRLQRTPGVTYAGKNYILFAEQVNSLNAIIGGESQSAPTQGSDRVATQPPATQQPPAQQPREAEAPTSEAPNDPFLTYEWHLKAYGPENTATTSPGGVDFPSAWTRQRGAGNVVIAILDTGLLLDHEDIKGSTDIAPGYDMLSDAFQGNDGDGRDADPSDPGDATAQGECYPDSPAGEATWHGTHVAGIIGAASTNNELGIAGGAWSATIVPVRVLGKCGGSMSDIVDGMLWAAGLPVEGAPINEHPADFINMSLGGGGACTPDVQAAIDTVVAKGVTVVVAAGNESDDAAFHTPASCENVIVVSASDARGYFVTSYSNFGANVDIMAPGGDVSRDDNQDGYADGVLAPIKDDYAFYNGTSMATPVVVAAGALLKANEPDITPAEIKARIKETARTRTTEQCPKGCGAGLLDVGELIQCSPPDSPTPECRAVAVSSRK